MARSLAEQLATVDGAQIVAVTDIIRERSANAAKELGAAEEESADALLERKDIDAVIVATPPDCHAGHICAALDAGKHVFSEKPLTLTVKDAMRCVKKARKVGRFLGTGQVLRYYQPWQTMLDCARSGRYGVPLMANEIRMGGPLSRMNVPWRNKISMCGGWLFEVGAHELDFICEVFDAWPETVSALAVPPDEKLTGTDHHCAYSVNMSFKGGGVGHYLCGQVDYAGSRWSRVLMSGGTINGTGGTVEVTTPVKDKTPVEVSEEGKENPVHRELRQFVEAIRKGKQPVPTDVEGMRAVSIACAAIESSDNGGAPVKVKKPNIE